jgi:hypothetical protein
LPSFASPHPSFVSLAILPALPISAAEQGASPRQAVLENDMSRKSKRVRRSAPIDVGAWIAALLALSPLAAFAWAIEWAGFA